MTAPALQRLPRAVGHLSLVLAGIALVRPRDLAAAAGVRVAGDDRALPVLVRLVAARQAVLGLELLTRYPPDVRRAAGLFLPLTALDLAAVAGGVLSRRSLAMAGAVLAVNAAVLGAARRDAPRG